jgi:hypothetical protein
MRILSTRPRRLVGPTVLAVALALPAGASASQFTVTTSTSATAAPATTSPAVTTATATSSSTGGGLSTLDDIGIVVVALGLFVSIAWYIHDDARLHLPRHKPNFSIDRERATVAPRADRVKRSRAKAKAARRARRAGR